MNHLHIKGEVYSDHLHRTLYATDASMYQILPDIVAVPVDADDLADILQYAKEHKLPILPRGSATSLAGQTVNRGIVIDFTKYFNQIVKYDAETRSAVVQPGVTRDQLNAIAAKDRLHFAPDPATSSRATFGGMIANNSSGTKSILYGKTSDHIISLKVMLTDGSILELRPHDQAWIDQKIAEGGREAELYKSLQKLIVDLTEDIRSAYPKVMRRVTGYALDAFVDTEKWNLANLITGSEGSLAIILEAEIKLTPLPGFQNMIAAHFTDRRKGIEAVKTIVGFGPAAVEVLDYNVLQQSKNNPVTAAYHASIITGEPQLVLTVEFYGDTKEEILNKTSLLTNFLTDYPTAYHFPVFHDMKRINDALALRRDGLGILMGKVADRKPQAFVEDSAIPLEHLAEYVEKVEKICIEKNVELVIYAHASVGVLHIRPYLDVTNAEDIELMKYISDQCFQLVKQFGGSWSGEHGDGRNRGSRIRDYYGEAIYNGFKTIKKTWDPDGLLNPEIIIDTPPMDQNLRYGPAYKDQQYHFQFHYRKDHSFQDLVHMCSGVGQCRKTQEGTMCPSFRATRNEKDSTRGRANILRLAMSGQYEMDNLLHPDVKDVMDLCLSCKACKTECPSNVDMAKLKSEVLHLHHEKYGTKLSERMVKWAPLASRILSGPLAPMINWVQHSSFGKAVLNAIGNISKQRSLPSYASQSLVSWAGKNNTFKSNKKVALYADTYINYHETDLGKDAIRLLNACGYEVVLADVGCCQRPLISNGFLAEAKSKGALTAAKLAPLLETNMYVVVLEPSCFSALNEDLPDLLDNMKLASLMNKKVVSLESFLWNEVKTNSIKGRFTSDEKLIIHGHCHQKSTGDMDDLKDLLSYFKVPFEILNTGCCGMAGAFGYEDQHFEISKQIVEERLLPALDAHKGSDHIIACGTSCRHQIKDLSDHVARHFVSRLKFAPDQGK